MHFQPTRTPWLTRPLLALQARRHGRALEPTQLWATRPRLLAPFLLMFRSLHRRSTLPATLRWLVAARVSQLCQCAFCVDMNAAQALEASTSRAKLDALADWRSSGVFTATERLALDYAEAMTATPVPDLRDKVLALRGQLGEAGVIELTALVGFQNFSARFNSALGAEAHGFCAVPARRPG
jgi:AhpD family alkylhydroperoxidase